MSEQMSKQASCGKCLCGRISWQIKGTPGKPYHCHCMMCRKAHGAAFATYVYIPTENFEWRSEIDTLKEYDSSTELTRTFCGTCGSVVPNPGDEEKSCFVVPLGAHDDAPEVEGHIFVASKAPWHDIKDNLPKYDAYPPEVDAPVIDPELLPPAKEGVLRGSCLCKAVEFEVTEAFKFIHNCHCSRCRQARSAAHTTNGFTSRNGISITKGAEKLITYQPTDAKYFTQVFCEICGSGMPRISEERNIAVVPLGALDDDPGCKADDHIFVGSKAQWYPITDDLPCFDEYPD